MSAETVSPETVNTETVSPTYVMIGEITIDDTVLENGEVRMAQTGGGALYSALGIHLWDESVGIHGVIGQEYLPAHLHTLARQGIDVAGITRVDGWGLRLWLLHEAENAKQQVPRLNSATLAQMDSQRPDPPEAYLKAKGYHLAPASAEGQMRARDLLRARVPDALLSLDLMADSFIDLDVYRSGEALEGVDLFVPSRFELAALWPDLFMDEAIAHIAEFGVRWIGIKMDEEGAVVCDTQRGISVHVPIFPARAVDTTGAGDAFAGGMLMGLGETGDVVQAGLRATVSASFAVEHWGAFPLLDVKREDAEERLTWLRKQMEFGS